jgi:hypothetical protein
MGYSLKYEQHFEDQYAFYFFGYINYQFHYVCGFATSGYGKIILVEQQHDRLK